MPIATRKKSSKKKKKKKTHTKKTFFRMPVTKMTKKACFCMPIEGLAPEKENRGYKKACRNVPNYFNEKANN